MHKNKKNMHPKYKTSVKENIKLLEEKIISNHNSSDVMNDMNKLEKINLSKNNSENNNNIIDNDKTSDRNSKNDKKIQEETNLIINNINSFDIENKNEKEQKENDVE